MRVVERQCSCLLIEHLGLSLGCAWLWSGAISCSGLGSCGDGSIVTHVSDVDR